MEDGEPEPEEGVPLFDAGVPVGVPVDATLLVFVTTVTVTVVDFEAPAVPEVVEAADTGEEVDPASLEEEKELNQHVVSKPRQIRESSN